MGIHQYIALPLLLLLIAVSEKVNAAEKPSSTTVDETNRIAAWEREIETSLRRNVKGKCKWKYTTNMNQSFVGDSDESFVVRRFYPSKVDFHLLNALPETLTQAYDDLAINAKARGYSYEDWGRQTESRWEVPANHPGQNRKNCLDMSFLAAQGKPVSFYNEFRNVDRAFYISYIQGGFVHPSGAVGASCGYYMGEECCENRWDYANEWYTRCQTEIKRQNQTWPVLWDTSLPPKQRTELIEQCTDHRDLGLPYNGKVESHLPVMVPKVFVMPSLWDYNYHHFIADSLARLVHSLRFLRRSPDVFIHVREFEKYDHMHYHDKQYAEASRVMRCRLLELLGLNCSRLVTGMVLAEDVMIPRCTRCAYALSNPAEIRLLRKLMVQASVMWVKERNPNDFFQKYLSTLPSKHRQHPQHREQQELLTQQMHLLPEPAHIPSSAVHAAKYSHTKSNQHHLPKAVTMKTKAQHHRRLWPASIKEQASPLSHSQTAVASHRNLTMVILQRWSARSTDRNWDDATLERVTKALKKAFPDHHQVVLSSKDAKSPDYCLACDVLTYTRADILVGAHGAGLTNVMFLPPHALLVEIVGEFKDVNMPVCGYYGPMASMFGIHHFLYVHAPPTLLNESPLNADVMAKRAAEFYRFLRSPQSKDEKHFIRVTNSTGGPVGCRP
jgi:hypothetical protein